jgi:hypothetical protein
LEHAKNNAFRKKRNRIPLLIENEFPIMGLVSLCPGNLATLRVKFFASLGVMRIVYATFWVSVRMKFETCIQCTFARITPFTLPYLVPNIFTSINGEKLIHVSLDTLFQGNLESVHIRIVFTWHRCDLREKKNFETVNWV